MLRQMIFRFSFLLFLSGMFFLSCSKSEETEMPPVDYPQLLGTWEGTTSQNQPIKLGFINFNGTIWVSTYKYDVFNPDSAGQVMNYDVSNSTLVTNLVNVSFGFRPYGGYSYYDYLKGSFDVNAMTLTGRFNTSFPVAMGTATDSVTGSFTAVKTSQVVLSNQ